MDVEGWLRSQPGRDSPTPPITALPACVLASEKAKEKLSPERISSVLTVDDPRGSFMLKLGRAGPAKPKAPGKGKKKTLKKEWDTELNLLHRSRSSL